MNRRAGFLLPMVVVLSVLLGCGGGSTGTSGSGEGKGYYKHGTYYPPGPSSQFVIPGDANTYPYFGREATKAERESASRTIEAWMRARAAQSWARDCSYFARAYVHSLVATDATRVTKGKVKTCPQALAYFGHAASGSYKDNLSGPIDSLRVGEGRGYALYHGNDGEDWVIPLLKEDGRWRIDLAAPVARRG